MTRPAAEYEEVLRLIAWGMNDCQISRLTGIPRGTIRDWRHGKRTGRQSSSEGCIACGDRIRCDRSYAYLLGMYLGDGYIARLERTYVLRIVLDQKYPDIIAECAAAMAIIRGRSSRGQPKIGCWEVAGSWNHWPCVFPQHGPGAKHQRSIKLAEWQQRIADRYPEYLLRGFIHSDGSRDLNFVNGKSYPRYQFSNFSADIQEIFCRACEIYGIHWTRPYWKTIAISRRPCVEKLDRVIGPKT